MVEPSYISFFFQCMRISAHGSRLMPLSYCNTKCLFLWTENMYLCKRLIIFLIFVVYISSMYPPLSLNICCLGRSRSRICCIRIQESRLHSFANHRKNTCASVMKLIFRRTCTTKFHKCSKHRKINLLHVLQVIHFVRGDGSICGA